MATLSFDVRVSNESISNFKKIRRLGQGFFGTVFLGELNGNYVAIKEFTPETSEDEIQKEIRAMGQLKHPRLVELIGVINKNGMISLVMEYMQEGDLRTFLQGNGRSLGEKELRHIAGQIAEGMAYLEAKGYIHRDLAARNVMVNTKNDVKIGDFGLARLASSKMDNAVSGYQAGTRAVYHWLWTAPEAMYEHRFTHKSDVWSFGCVLYELFSYGELPRPSHIWIKPDFLDFLEKGNRLGRPSTCPEGVYKIMLQCWSKDPSQRPTFSALKSAF